jgi:glycosyltransferase involved in cell wall biosynthesis
MPVTVLAAHTGDLLAPDPANVIRCWNVAGNFDAIAAMDMDVLVVQYHYGLFNNGCLANLIRSVVAKNTHVIVMIHSLGPGVANISTELNMCKFVTVQSTPDLKTIRSQGVTTATVFAHGIQCLPVPDKKTTDDSVLIGNFGFFLPNKGLLELISAIHLLRSQDMYFRLRLVNAEHPASISRDLIAESRLLIDHLGLTDHVELHTKFLPDTESLRLLSECDLIVNSYQHTSEPVSGSVRYGIASGRPVAVTPQMIFEELEDILFYLPGDKMFDIAAGIVDTWNKLQNPDAATISKLQRLAYWRQAHDYRNLAPVLAEMITR